LPPNRAVQIGGRDFGEDALFAGAPGFAGTSRLATDGLRSSTRLP